MQEAQRSISGSISGKKMIKMKNVFSAITFLIMLLVTHPLDGFVQELPAISRREDAFEKLYGGKEIPDDPVPYSFSEFFDKSKLWVSVHTSNVVIPTQFKAERPHYQHIKKGHYLRQGLVLHKYRSASGREAFYYVLYSAIGDSPNDLGSDWTNIELVVFENQEKPERVFVRRYEHHFKEIDANNHWRWIIVTDQDHGISSPTILRFELEVMPRSSITRR